MGQPKKSKAAEPLVLQINTTLRGDEIAATSSESQFEGLFEVLQVAPSQRFVVIKKVGVNNTREFRVSEFEFTQAKFILKKEAPKK
jgi:hypothetical protein